MDKINSLTMDQQNELLGVLEARFNNNMNRHSELKWVDVLEKIGKDIPTLQINIFSWIVLLKALKGAETSVTIGKL
jgi:hypothetical protein